MRVKKHRLKAMPEKRSECYKLDSSKLCFSDQGTYPYHWFYMQRCVGYDPKTMRPKCTAEVEGYIEPSAKYAYISVQQTYPQEWRGKGFGGKTYRLLEQFLKERKGVQMVHLSALQTALNYWKRQGFGPLKCSWNREKCRLGFPEDEEETQERAKLLCGYAKDFEGRKIRQDTYRISEVHPSAAPNVPCYLHEKV